MTGRSIGPGSGCAEAVPVGAASCVFGTAIGSCAILWRGDRIVGTRLPGSSAAALRAEAVEAEPSPQVSAVIAEIRALLAGEPVDFASTPLDFGDASSLERQVWDATRAISAGETRTYGDIAAAIGAPGAARAVGRALGRNPLPIIVPCHRVVAAAGRSGGFSAPGGASTKMRMLAIENARRGTEPLLFERLPWALKD